METFPSKNISISWVEKGSLLRNLSLSFGFAILTALSAQIRFELPFTPVPITAQTFVVILSGLLLGSKFGSLSMIFYLFTGLAGFPFFSGSVAGLAILKSPTIGYIIGFFIALLLNSVEKFKSVYYFILLLPLLINPIVVGLIWRMFLHPQFLLIPGIKVVKR